MLIVEIVSEKKGVGEWFRIYGRVGEGCIMSPWLFNVYMDAVMKEVKKGIGRREVRFMEEGRE